MNRGMEDIDGSNHNNSNNYNNKASSHQWIGDMKKLGIILSSYDIAASLCSFTGQKCQEYNTDYLLTLSIFL